MRAKSLPLDRAAVFARRVITTASGFTGRGQLRQRGMTVSGITRSASKYFPGVMVARDNAGNFPQDPAIAMAFAIDGSGFSSHSIVPNLNRTPSLTGINFSAGWPGKGFAHGRSRGPSDSIAALPCLEKKLEDEI